MPSTPAPRRPAASPLPNPKRRGWAAEPKPELPKPELGVSLRCIGCDQRGAVLVEGGIEKVRLPREPKLKPPPARASTDEVPSGRASTSVSARRVLLSAARLGDVGEKNLVIVQACNGPNARSPDMVSHSAFLQEWAPNRPR